MKIGVVSGDDVLHFLQETTATKEAFANLDSRIPLATVRDRLVTANAYLGCEGIVEALRAGAEIVITGRVADPSLVVAPCVYAFGWEASDWDRLAGATVAGHLLECGTQVTGGISTDWLDIRDPAHIGFPIAEIDADGSCVITKSELAGGLVIPETVKEQLVYEIGDPSQYVSPDVTVSFLNLDVKQLGDDRVSVRGAKGRPHPKMLKVSATYRDGFRAAGMLTIFGPDSALKARRCGELVLERLHTAGRVYTDAIVECLGNAASVPVVKFTTPAVDSLETVLRVAVESQSREAVEHFSRELMQLVTGGPQGATGYAEGRPRVHDVFRYWPCLIDADQVQPRIECLDSADTLVQRNERPDWPPKSLCFKAPAKRESFSIRSKSLADASRLADIAYGRSGDKGTGANVGILLRDPEHYDWLKSWLTAQRVKEFFQEMGVESVERYELPNLCGFNFVIRGVLRRGLRNDAQGKALAQALLTLPLRATGPGLHSCGSPT